MLATLRDCTILNLGQRLQNLANVGLKDELRIRILNFANVHVVILEKVAKILIFLYAIRLKVNNP